MSGIDGVDDVGDSNTIRTPEAPYSAVSNEQEVHHDARQYSFDQAMDEIGFGLYQLVLMQLCGGGWLFDGIELTMVSFIVPVLTKQWNISPAQAGALASVVFLGMAFGAQMGGVISDRFGRKIVFIGSVFIVALFGLASAFAWEYYSFLFLRLAVGVGLGACVPTDFSYLMEFVPRHNRGTILGMLNIYWAVGAMTECLLAWLCLTAGSRLPGEGWRWLVGFSSIPGFIMFLSRVYCSESPRFMLISGRYEEAKSLVTRIAGYNRQPVPHGYLVAPHPDHKLAIVEQFKGLFKHPYLRVTLLLWPIWFCTSYGGWGFNFLIPIVFTKLGTVNVYLSTLIVTAVGLFSTIFVVAVMDRIPRIPHLAVSFICAGVATLLVGVSNHYIAMLVVAMISNFISNFPWAVVYTYTPEVYPTQFRATGMGAASVWTRIAGTITPIAGNVMLERVGFMLPFVTFGISFTIAGFLSFFLPVETLGRPLDDVAVTNFKKHDDKKTSDELVPLTSDLGEAENDSESDAQ